MIEKIDKGEFNRKTLPKWTESFAKFEEKSPILAKTGKFALANSMWILLGAAFAQMFVHSSRKQNSVEQNYYMLKTTQTDTAKELLKTKESEKIKPKQVETIKQDIDFQDVKEIQIIKIIRVPDKK